MQEAGTANSTCLLNDRTTSGIDSVATHNRLLEDDRIEEHEGKLRVWGGSRLRDDHLSCFNWTVFSSPHNEHSAHLRSSQTKPGGVGTPKDVCVDGQLTTAGSVVGSKAD